jgi:predicted phosphodiesterase
MKIKLYSDLHLEFYTEGYFPAFLKEYTDVLILAGDITVGKKNTEAFLKKVSPFHNHVLFVAGNHEYYGQNINCLDDLDTPMNVHFLNPGSIQLGDTTFIGCTLWTDFQNDAIAEHSAAKRINDFRVIKDFTTKECIRRHRKDLGIVRSALNSTKGKRVVITHFLPSAHCISPRFAGPTLINKYFANNLDELILETKPDYWFFGHTHDSIAVQLGNTKLFSNPLGYIHEANKEFNPNLQLEI